MNLNQNLDSTVITDNEPSSSFGASDRGQVRETNQDQFLIAYLNQSMLVASTSLEMERQLFGNAHCEILLVADGMGGHAAGEKASRLAIGHLVNRLLNSVHSFFQHDSDEQKEEAFVADLKDALKDAHTRILRESARHADQRGMGTTLTMAHLMWPRLYVVHAGDSRCYLIRDGVAQQLTTDHTLARQMVESGGLKPEDEAASKWSNILWNVLGGNSDSELIAEVHRVDLQVGDKLMLCTDGLHRYVDNQRIAKIVSESDSSAEACRQLIALANHFGGEDNITVIVSKPEAEEIHLTTWIEDFDTVIPDDE